METGMPPMTPEYKERTVKAQSTLDLLSAIYGHEVEEDVGIHREKLVEIAKICNGYTYGKPIEDELDVERNIEDYINGLRITNPIGAIMAEQTHDLPEQRLITLAAGRWYEQGLPVIRLGHKRAAALMATDITEQSIEFVKPPFHAFLIDLPDDLLHVEGRDGKLYKATMVLVHTRFLGDGFMSATNKRYPPGLYWNYAIFTTGIIIQWKLNRTTAEVANLSDRGNQWVGYGMPIGAFDSRVDHLVGNLVCSTCIMMSNPENLKVKYEATKRNKNGKKPVKGCDNYRVFTERQPINVDVRRYIRAYVRGERDSPHVRLMVRGHHKMQHHGPQRSLRKLIWVEPYVRGGDGKDPIMNSIYTAKDKE